MYLLFHSFSILSLLIFLSFLLFFSLIFPSHSSYHTLFTQRAFQFQLQPVVNTLRMELMATVHCLNHLPILQHFQTYSTVSCFSPFGLLILKSGQRIYYVYTLFWSNLRLFIFVLRFFIILLLGLLSRMSLTELELLIPAIRASCIRVGTSSIIGRDVGIECVSIEIHLDVGRNHSWDLVHHIRQVTKHIA